jgi:hypothetical protein
MHKGVQWPTPRLKSPDNRKICGPFRTACEAFRKSGRFKRCAKSPVNVSLLSQANDGGALVLSPLFGLDPLLRKLVANGGYRGPHFRAARAMV